MGIIKFSVKLKSDSTHWQYETTNDSKWLPTPNGNEELVNQNENNRDFGINIANIRNKMQPT